MFVLMVAALPFLLSDQPPEVPRKVGLGDRFHYFRGASGRRYLFSEVTATDLADFRGAVFLAAERLGSSRLAATWIGTIDTAGRLAAADQHWPRFRPGVVMLVHLLAVGERKREAAVADLVAAGREPAAQLALPLAA
jgi:nitroreductase